MEIDTLVSNITSLGFKTHVILKKDWKYSDISHLFEPKKVFIFSTEDVGCGEFGLSYPDEIKKEKWLNAYGIVQCIDYKDTAMTEIGVSFSVIPKLSFDKIKIIASCLKSEQECSICNKISKHVKIDTEIGLVYCMDCYRHVPTYSVLTFSL
jgi:hypothetical protein